jgi:hypothetical protein
MKMSAGLPSSIGHRLQRDKLTAPIEPQENRKIAAC